MRTLVRIVGPLGMEQQLARLCFLEYGLSEIRMGKSLRPENHTLHFFHLFPASNYQKSDRSAMFLTLLLRLLRKMASVCLRMVMMIAARWRPQLKWPASVWCYPAHSKESSRKRPCASKEMPALWERSHLVSVGWLTIWLFNIAMV